MAGQQERLYNTNNESRQHEKTEQKQREKRTKTIKKRALAFASWTIENTFYDFKILNTFKMYFGAFECESRGENSIWIYLVALKESEKAKEQNHHTIALAWQWRGWRGGVCNWKGNNKMLAYAIAKYCECVVKSAWIGLNST